MAAINEALSGIADWLPPAADSPAVSLPTPLPHAVTPAMRAPASSTRSGELMSDGDRIGTSKV
jgi:hypothetical protein